MKKFRYVEKYFYIDNGQSCFHYGAAYENLNIQLKQEWEEYFEKETIKVFDINLIDYIFFIWFIEKAFYEGNNINNALLVKHVNKEIGEIVKNIVITRNEFTDHLHPTLKGIKKSYKYHDVNKINIEKLENLIKDKRKVSLKNIIRSISDVIYSAYGLLAIKHIIELFKSSCYPFANKEYILEAAHPYSIFFQDIENLIFKYLNGIQEQMENNFGCYNRSEYMFG